jgi:hemolysin activation/secretion protein
MRIRIGLIGFIFAGCLFGASVGAQTGYEPLRFTVSSFKISGDNPIGEKAQQVLAPFLGDQYGLAGLSAAADALEREILDRGFSFHRVNLPPQELNAGTIEFKILKFAVGSLKISGNQNFDEANIMYSLPELREGETPNTKELSRSLKLANNHASKKLVLKFVEGQQADTIDADIAVSDRDPQVVFVSLDNSGNKDAEQWRSTLGYQHGNLFNKDHAVTATVTFAPEDPSATRQFGVSYHIPLYSHGGNLDFLVSDSEIDSGEVAEDVSVSGKGSVFGVTYSRPMLTDTNFNHQWSVGAMAKTFENDLNVAGTELSSDVLSFPLEVGYAFDYTARASMISGGVTYAMNIDSGSNNTDDDYSLARPGAKNDWTALRYRLSYDLFFAEKWMFHAGLTGQGSSDLLISGEQFGVGGSSTLRGFESRSVTGDKGHQVSLEVWTPPYYGVRYLGFIDAASLELNEGDDYDLSSFGVGLRWNWKQQLSVSLDYAAINQGGGPDDTINQDNDDRAHLSLVYRF